MIQEILNSNARCAFHLEAIAGIAALREAALKVGCDLTIQPDGLYVSRPGLEQALFIWSSEHGHDFEEDHLHSRIFDAADTLWEMTDGYPPEKQSDISKSPI